MCLRNPRNCALHGWHSDPCISALELNKREIEELMDELIGERNEDV